MTRSFKAILPLLFIRASVSVEDPSVADQLRGLLSDTRFQACEQDANNPSCMAVRDEAEQKIMLQQNHIDEDLITSKAYIASLRDELIAKVAELKKMNETLVGSMFAPGLVDQYQGLTSGISQMETVLDGADKSITDEITKRGDLYSQEMGRISDAQQASADSAQAAMIKLANSNLLAQSSQIRAIGNIYGRSLADLGAQSSDLLTADDAEIADMQAEVTQSEADTQDELAIITQSASVAREDAKAVAAVGNATFKLTEANLFKQAQAQLPTYKAYSDALMAAAKQDMNSTLTDTIHQISDKIVSLRGDLLQQFSDSTDQIYENITKLKDAAGAIVPAAIAQGNDLIDQATVKIQSAQAAADTSTASVKQLTSDTAKMLSDVSDEINAVSTSSQDQQAQANAKLNEDVSGVQSAANDQVSNMNDGVSGELATLSGQIHNTQTGAAAQTQQARDSYIAQLAGIQSDSGQTSAAALTAVGDASAAATSLASLNSARLQAVTDTSQAQINGVGATVQGALQDARDTSADIESQVGQRNRQLELDSGQAIADATSDNAQTVRGLSGSVDSSFADVQSDIIQGQQLSQAQVQDLKTALSALSSGSDAVGSKAAALEQSLQSMTSGQLMQFQQLLSQMGTSSSLIDSTSQAAQAQLKAAVMAQLNERMTGLGAALSSNQQAVSSALSGAISDAKDTADQLALGTTNLTGNFHQTSADMNALYGTLTGASGSVASSAAALQSLIKSMTGKEVIDFKLKISQLSGDSADAQSKLRSYLSALITNKTDTARVDTQQVFLSNKQALIQVLNGAGDELTATKDLAARALLDNQVVRANTSRLFDDFLTTEQRLGNISNAHTSILQDIQKNITDWKADIVKRINEIQGEVAEGSSQLPQYAEDRLKNITVLISMNQDDLKSFLTQFQASLDRAKAIQDHFQDSQAGRIISAMTGVSQAIVTASVRMAAQVAQSDMSANDKARALTEVLSELCGSIDKANADAGANDAAISARVRAMGNNVNGTVEDIAKQVNAMMNSLATDKLNKDISLSNTMQQAVTDAGVGINASANAIELAQQAIHRAVEKSSAGWANNNKDVYTLGGFLFSLSQQSQQKLLYILQQLQHGTLNMDQALALARQADISQIKSAQDVVSVLVGAMDGYDQTVESVFGTSFQRLEDASANLSSRVDGMVGDLVTLASVLDYNSSMLAHRVDAFTNISDKFINATQTNVSDLETYIFDQQAQVTRALSALGSLMDYSEKDVTLRQQQFSNWIDSLIANETVVIGQKTQNLKTALLGNSSVAASFVQESVDPKDVAKANVEVLRAEMVELDRRRHNLRKRTGVQQAALQQ